MSNFFDTCAANAASSLASKNVLLAGDFVNANPACMGSVTDGAATNNIVGGNAAIKGAVKDARHSTTAVGANSASSVIAAFRVRAKDKPKANAASSVAEKDTLIAHNKADAVFAAGSVSETDSSATHNITGATAEVFMDAVSFAESITAVSARMASSVTAKSKHRARDVTLARAASSVASSSQTSQNAHVQASMASSVHEIDRLLAHDRPNASSALYGANRVTIAPALDGNLIECCRYWCMNSFPEIANKSTGQRVVEALPPTSAQLRDADFPSVIIIAGEPTAFDQAVQDVAQHVQIDFVYHVKTFTDNLTDTAQYIRGRLNILRSNLITDFHLTQANGGYLVQDTNIVADPLQKTTAYTNVFAPDNMNVSTMVLSARFTLVTSALGV
jgi:hypothetical protein